MALDRRLAATEPTSSNKSMLKLLEISSARIEDSGLPRSIFDARQSRGLSSLDSNSRLGILINCVLACRA